MLQLRLQPSSTKYEYVGLTGGLDLLTPTLQLKPGYVRDALNWEVSTNGGYSRIFGYERVDGRQAPSSATYETVTVTIIVAPTIGATVVGSISGATATVLDVQSTLNGVVIAMTQAVSAFVVGDILKVGGVSKATVTALAGTGDGADYDVTMLSLAANVYRALIGAVPGSGKIIGVATLAGILYAWRNNAGGTAQAIYKATAGGWVNVPLLFQVSFTAGTAAYAVGSTLTQGGVSATVRQVALQSGAWGSAGAGRLIISAPTGGSFSAGVATGGGGATLSGVQTAITLAPGGRIETDIGNFSGVPKIYGCDGVNLGWEFDGSVLAPIVTGNVPDIPQHVVISKDALWFSFATNVQASGLTTPFNWSAVAGSIAFRLPAQVTVMLRQPGDQTSGALSISTTDSTFMVYGSSAANFSLVPFEESAGARPYSGQRLGGQSLVFSDLGVFSLSATQSFGNFEPASMTMKIRPFTQTRRSLCSGSIVNREKSQYRVFFSDGSGLYLTVVNGKLQGSMPMQFPNDVTCNCTADAPDGTETSFFGSSNGFVYRLDAGTSHDGAVLNSYFTATYTNEGNSRVWKRYTGCSFEVQGTGFAQFDFTYDLAYGSADRPQGSTPDTTNINLQPVYWDSFVWDTFTWDGRSLGPSHAEMAGTGENVALHVECNSDKYPSFTLNSAIIHYITRKALKK